MKNILIVDDYPLMRKKLIEILREVYPAANIKEVGNGQEALQQIMLLRWNLVLMDINMPGPNGLTTLITAKQLAKETPILMLSLNTEYFYAIKAIKSGASGFLTKESSFEELIDAINEVQNGRKYITKALASKCCKKENVENPSLIEPYQSN
ncbi:MAG: response regulator transcription factor [Bacteroidetes bacterium]|nr:response regulator transcription factor [Bacteroidota bacterium]